MPRRRSSSRTHVAIIIDYDNFAIYRRENRIKISFEHLIEHAAQYGTVVLAEAYLSPTANSPTNVERITRGGFHAIACPLDKHDKDTVDFHIQEQTTRLLNNNAVDTVLIVSRDNDFRYLIPWASTIGRTVHMINISELADRKGLKRPALRGDFASNYMQVIERLREGMSIKEIKERPAHDLVRHIIIALWQTENTRRVSRLGFQELKGRVFQKLDRRWKTGSWQPEVELILKTFIKMGVLKRKRYQSKTYYELDKGDSILVSCIKR